MPHRPRKRRHEVETAPLIPAPPASERPEGLGSGRTALLVVLLLAIHYALAVDSLRRENPTVDEIAHLPAGVSYWEKGTFRLYRHNPPLSKLVAALPVVFARPETTPLYDLKSWTGDPPSQADFGHAFAFLNASRYFELFTAARMVMPLFSVIGGLAIFAWSSRMFGRAGGLLSLALWCLCPNVMAHARLVTGDVAGATMGVGATFLFWCTLKRPTWTRAVLAGLLLGLAALTKFSLILLYGYWPLLWLARIAIERDVSGWPRRLVRDAGQGAVIVGVSLATICAGYGFEKVGTPLGSFDFVCRSLTRDLTPAEAAGPIKSGQNPLLNMAWRHRVNRFRGTPLAGLPVPLPYHFLAGFDEQRIETEGLPARWQDPAAPADKTLGYPVYLDGVLRQTGWWYYYLACLAYKLPEGTWIVIGLSFAALFVTWRTRSRPDRFDAVAVLAFPAIVLFAMSALTDINLGLRYVLPIVPFVYVACGRVVPWMAGMAGRARGIMVGVVGVGLGLTAVQTGLVHPSYLASFNWASGGPDRGSDHLIDSNLDWGQDLVPLRAWLAKHRPGQSVGLAYFGQINPSLFALRGEEFAWFLPPVLPGTTEPMGSNLARVGPARRLRPGVYAVSASLVRGLPWRVYDSGDPLRCWGPGWNAGRDAFSYFAALTPTAKVGHSIFVYDLTEADCARINPRLGPGAEDGQRSR